MSVVCAPASLDTGRTVSDYWRMVRTAQFELSHKCTRDGKHHLCPIKQLRAEFDGFLPSSIIFDVCKQLVAARNTSAHIYFHLYNEPSIDCRLAWLIHTLRYHLEMPNELMVQSNTDGLDINIIKDLIECGCNNVTLSTDDETEFDKWIAIKNELDIRDMRFRVNKKRHDNRLNIYKGEHLEVDPIRRKNFWELEAAFRCTCPLSHFLVGANGDVVFCEFDWERTLNYGRLPNDLYETIFARKQAIYDQIHDKGNKNAVAVCSKCTMMFRSW